ncbi:MAG: aspartyl/glutamyl-tRNA amidotransferase subunit C [Elusimicrobiaceae bacterium]|nr:aspartyl/glutamyl-tRNA amidotransferase subunit C [Elusimicrobiaceae bacterium]MBR3899903.1 aspartyl/glutamyl-tRNA amidotransferase subunit C [Elusimicrobiaceae bacterium]
MRLDQDHATTCARSAKIALTENEAQKYQSQLQELFAWVKQLSSVDVSAVEETAAVRAAYLRPDEPVTDEALVQTLVGAFSDKEGTCAKVKKVL